MDRALEDLRPHPRTGDDSPVSYRAKHIRALFAEIDRLTAALAQPETDAGVDREIVAKELATIMMERTPGLRFRWETTDEEWRSVFYARADSPGAKAWAEVARLTRELAEARAERDRLAQWNEVLRDEERKNDNLVLWKARAEAAEQTLAAMQAERDHLIEVNNSNREVHHQELAASRAEVERLREAQTTAHARIAELSAALGPLSFLAGYGDFDPPLPNNERVQVCLGDLRRARSALSPNPRSPE